MEELIFIDLDKTLINPSYKLTADLSKVVALCNVRGIGLGLCSDTPLDPLKHWAKKLGFNGPIVAELGALVYFPEDGESIIIHPELTGFFSEIRSDFLKNLAGFLPNITIFVGDNVQFIAEKITFDFFGDMVVLISGYRSQSMAFHVRRYDRNRGLLVKDARDFKTITDLVMRVMTKCGVDLRKIYIDANEEYGIVIIHSLNTNKKDGVVLAMKKLGMSRVGMIGDSVADFMDDPSVIQLAVANARPEYKEKCIFVTPFEHTKGVGHLLEEIASGHLIV